MRVKCFAQEHSTVQSNALTIRPPYLPKQLFDMIFIVFLLLQEPTAPPANVTAYNTSSIGIIVFWEQIPKAHRHGYVLGYKVCYKRADKNDSVLYCTAVGYTNKGEGPSSRPLLVWTDEFGKCVGNEQ